VEHRQVAELAALHLVADGGDRGVAAVRVPDRGHDVRALLQLDHRPGVLQGAGERLLAQDVLAGRYQRLGDRPVQGVADHDAHRVDRGIVGDLLPAVHGLLEAVPVGGVVGEFLVGVGDGGQPDPG
jgi:hypothetical protein